MHQQSGKPAWGRRLRTGLLAVAASLSGGCVVTIDNDSSTLGGNDDRWYTSGWRLQRDLAALEPDQQHSWLDAGTVAVAGWLELLPAGDDDGEPRFTTVSLVGGQHMYTPADLDANDVVLDDRPYAGWLYAGVVRYDTWLDPDPLRRRDVEHAVELNLGIVGPEAYAQEAQELVHNLITSKEPDGWDNQLGNEPGLVLRAARSARDVYAHGLTDGGLAFDAISRVGGAVGNVDTSAGLAETLRLGWNLPRSFDLQAGDRQRLLPGGARTGDEAASVYGFLGAEGRVVLRNIFLDGNTFRDSHEIDKELLVGTLSFGVAWEWNGFRAAYTRMRITDEFEGQPEGQIYGSLTLGWTRSF